jgi:hypothetical protein
MSGIMLRNGAISSESILGILYQAVLLRLFLVYIRGTLLKIFREIPVILHENAHGFP